VSAGDIGFDAGFTQQEFRAFSQRVGEAIFPSPVDGAGGEGLFGFDVGLAATVVPIDENASYWQRAIDSDFSTRGYVYVPRLVVSKGIGVMKVSGSLARVPGSDLEVWGGSFDAPVIRGGLARPAVSLRGSYSQLRGVEVYDVKTYGAELFISKGFGLVTPFAGAGKIRTSAEGRIPPLVLGGAPVTLREEIDENRYTVGLKISMFIPKIVFEASQASERSYAVKISLGL